MMKCYCFQYNCVVIKMITSVIILFDHAKCKSEDFRTTHYYSFFRPSFHNLKLFLSRQLPSPSVPIYMYIVKIIGLRELQNIVHEDIALFWRKQAIYVVVLFFKSGRYCLSFAKLFCWNRMKLSWICGMWFAWLLRSYIIGHITTADI